MRIETTGSPLELHGITSLDCYEIAIFQPVEVDDDTFQYRITQPFLAANDKEAITHAKQYMASVKEAGMEFVSYQVLTLRITKILDNQQRNDLMLFDSAEKEELEDNMPDGYIILEEKEDYIIVGMTMKHFNAEAKPEIIYHGKRYARGLMEALPKGSWAASNLCGARIYNLNHVTFAEDQ